MRERESGAKQTGVRKGKVMVVEGDSCEKDLRLIGREFHRRGKELRKERSDNVTLKVSGGRKRQVVR